MFGENKVIYVNQKPAHYPIARLAVAGYVILALLAWIGFVPGSFPSPNYLHDQVELVPTLVTATISLLVIAILAPVLWRGPNQSRWLAAMLSILPAAIFAISLRQL